MSTTQRVDWTLSEEASGLTFRWGYAGEDLVAEWVGILGLRATRNGELKSLHPVPGAPHDLVEKTRLGVAEAFLRAQRNEHALHASAVVWEGKALMCVGASGLGKSTMADRLCRHPGVELLGDDVTGIEVLPSGDLQVPPSESTVWLIADGSSAKAPVRSSRAANHAAKLRCIVSLVFDDAARVLELRDIRGADAVSALLPSLLRFEKTPTLWARELDFMGCLILGSRIVEARRSRDVVAETVADALLGLLHGDF